MSNRIRLAHLTKRKKKVPVWSPGPGNNFGCCPRLPSRVLPRRTRCSICKLWWLWRWRWRGGGILLSSSGSLLFLSQSSDLWLSHTCNKAGIYVYPSYFKGSRGCQDWGFRVSFSKMRPIVLLCLNFWAYSSNRNTISNFLTYEHVSPYVTSWGA